MYEYQSYYYAWLLDKLMPIMMKVWFSLLCLQPSWSSSAISIMWHFTIYFDLSSLCYDSLWSGLCCCACGLPFCVVALSYPVPRTFSFTSFTFDSDSIIVMIYFLYRSLWPRILHLSRTNNQDGHWVYLCSWVERTAYRWDKTYTSNKQVGAEWRPGSGGIKFGGRSDPPATLLLFSIRMPPGPDPPLEPCSRLVHTRYIPGMIVQKHDYPSAAATGDRESAACESY